MPIYDYECPGCGQIFERIQKSGDAAPECPSCGRTETKKRIAPFRTNGWSTFLDGMERRVNPSKFT